MLVVSLLPDRLGRFSQAVNWIYLRTVSAVLLIKRGFLMKDVR